MMAKAIKIRKVKRKKNIGKNEKNNGREKLNLEEKCWTMKKWTKAYLALKWIVKSLNELKASRLAATGSSNECHGFAMIDFEIESLKNFDIFSGRIAKVYVLELDIANDGFKFLSIFTEAVNRWHSIEDLEYGSG